MDYFIIFNTSSIFLTPIISNLYLSFNSFLLFSGIIHFLNPNFSASFNLFSIILTALTSPVNPTSPIATKSLGILMFLKLDTTAKIIPKSIAGSEILIPLTTFKYTSCEPSKIPPFFSKTAINKVSLFPSKPFAVLLGSPKAVGVVNA